MTKKSKAIRKTAAGHLEIDCPKCGSAMWWLDTVGEVIRFRCSRIGCGCTESVDAREAQN